jgi:hypothetical protein
MSQLSNLLRQRLGAQISAENNGAGVHPDADTLTAYSEQLLPVAERQQVLKHLAACSDCREVLTLSQAEIPEAALQPVLTPAPVSLWRRLFSPAFGIAGLLAGMAIIAVLVLQRPQTPGERQGSKEAQVAPLSDQKTASEAKPVVPAQPEPAIRSNELDSVGRSRNVDNRPAAAPVAGLAALGKRSALPNKLAAAKSAAPAAAPPIFTAELRKQDFVNRAFLESMNGVAFVEGQSSNDVAAAPQPSPSQTRLNMNGAAGIASFSDIPPNGINGKPSVAILNPPPRHERFGDRLDKWVIKGATAVFRPPSSAPAIRSNSLSSSAMLGALKPSESAKSEPNAVAAPPAKDSTELAASGAFGAASGRSLSSAETSAATWKVADGKLLKAYGQSPWEEARTPAAFEFTWVSAQGGQVWAGGTNAGLIHSFDGGNTWSLVKLGEGASGSIVNILFAGNHVQVKTSDDQSWSSSDGGKSWTQN